MGGAGFGITGAGITGIGCAGTGFIGAGWGAMGDPPGLSVCAGAIKTTSRLVTVKDSSVRRVLSFISFLLGCWCLVAFNLFWRSEFQIKLLAGPVSCHGV